MKKLISIILVLVMLFSMDIVSLAASSNEQFLSFEVDGMQFSSDEYRCTDFYYQSRKDGDNIVVEIFSRPDKNVVEQIVFYPPEIVRDKTRGESYVLRTYKDTVYETVAGIKVFGATNEVVLKLYVYNSFKQIESIENNRVYSSDGVSLFNIDGITTAATPTNGSFPTNRINLYYSATGKGTIDVQTHFGLNAEAGVKKLASVGFQVSSTTGTTVYFTKTINKSWVISI